jgi:hypothetical protein
MTLKNILNFLKNHVNIFFVVFFFFLSCKEPATEETIKGVLQNEIDKKDFLKGYKMKISLLELINNHKKEILDSLIEQNYKAECNDLGFSKHRMPPNLSRNLFNKCSFVASEDILNSLELIICENQPFVLRQFKTDYENYLGIHYVIFKSDSSFINHKNKYYKEVVINKKYHFGVEVIDAFDSIDPNNLAPN